MNEEGYGAFLLTKKVESARNTLKLNEGSKASSRLKNAELRLISELMKNSRQSDRQLAKALGVSQPTVSRMIAKLEKEGFVKEYTMVPDFVKLGFKLMAVTFVKLRVQKDPERLARAKRFAVESKDSSGIVMVEVGVGMGYDAVFISYHKDYASYSRLHQRFKKQEFIEVEGVEGFLINLDNKMRYLPLTLGPLSQQLLLPKNEET